MKEPQKIIIEPLDPTRHRRAEFDCGVLALNVYLQRNARREMEMEGALVACIVPVLENDRGCIAGFFHTLGNYGSKSKPTGYFDKRLGTFQKLSRHSPWTY